MSTRTCGSRKLRTGALALSTAFVLMTAAPAAVAQTPGTVVVQQLGKTFSAVAERVSPSVVSIDVTVGSRTTPWGSVDRGSVSGMGSGVILNSEGAILTNNHVIDGAYSINVRLHDGRIYAAKLLGRDPATDLAVIKIEASGLPAATFGNSDDAKVGQWVLAIGSPFGLSHSVTTGVLSAKGRGGLGVNAVEDYLQTDASINPGNSGGPLVDLDGKVIGINTMIVSRGQGIGLAVPAELALGVAEQLRSKGMVERAWIGIGIQDLTPQIAGEMTGAPERGALVNAIRNGGPAEKANLAPGDVIVTLDGHTIVDAQGVLRHVFNRSAGDAIELEVIRAGDRFSTKITLESRGDPPPPPLPIQQKPAPSAGLGLALSSAAGQPPEVIGVTHDSAADRAGLRVGDRILSADGIDAPSAKQVADEAADGGLLLRVQRGVAIFYAAVR